MIPFPTMATVIASTTADISSYSTFVLPFIMFPFVVIVVVATVTLIVRMMFWLGHKISALVHPHASFDERSMVPGSWEASRAEFMDHIRK